MVYGFVQFHLRVGVLMKTIAMTGYFGVPGTFRSTVVHAVDENRVGICGYRAHKSYEFQWCARGLYENYVECRTCLRLIRKNRERTSLANTCSSFGGDGRRRVVRVSRMGIPDSRLDRLRNVRRSNRRNQLPLPR